MRPQWRRLLIPFTSLLLFALAAIGVKQSGLTYNNSPSEPEGFYWLKPVQAGQIHRGDKVSFCPPVKRADYPFLQRGFCPGGIAPFFKTVVGVPGDVVDVSARKVSINGHTLANSASMQRSVHLSIALPHAYGTWKLGVGQYWVYGSGLPKYSFDSRYWGRLSGKSVTGVSRS